MANATKLRIRDATTADLRALCAIRNSVNQFKRYLEQANGDGVRFLVCERRKRLVAFSMLYMKQPVVGEKKSHIPKISDLYVTEGCRSQGIGTAMMGRMERIASKFGHRTMYLSVDPVENHRALALYTRLGYVPLAGQPARKRLVVYDDMGYATEREVWDLDLGKALTQ